jgi:hypothetical protein
MVFGIDYGLLHMYEQSLAADVGSWRYLCCNGKSGNLYNIWGDFCNSVSCLGISCLALFVDIIPRLPVTSGFCSAGKVVSGIVFAFRFRNRCCLLGS